jgi:hypothetical protein
VPYYALKEASSLAKARIAANIGVPRTPTPSRCTADGHGSDDAGISLMNI